MEEAILVVDHKMAPLDIVTSIKNMITQNHIFGIKIPRLKLSMLKTRLRAICSSPIVVLRLKQKMYGT